MQDAAASSQPETAPGRRIRMLRLTLAWIVAAAWLASGVSRLVEQYGQVWSTEERSFLPGPDRERARAALRLGREAAAHEPLIGVVGPSTDVLSAFLAFRLSYELYPVRVLLEREPPGSLAESLDQMRYFKVQRVLVIDAPARPLPGWRIAAVDSASNFVLATTAAGTSRPRP